MHLLLSVVLYAPGLLVFLYARKTHTHDNVLNRQEMVLIGMLLIASVPATDAGGITFIPSLDSKGDNDG